MPASLVFASFYLPVSVDTGSTSQRNDAVNTARLGQSGLRRLRFLVPEQWLLSPRSLLSQFHDFYWITNRRFDFFWFSSSNNNCLVENGLVENGLVENSLVENGLIQQHRSLQQNFFGFDTAIMDVCDPPQTWRNKNRTIAFFIFQDVVGNTTIKVWTLLIL